MDRYGGVLQDIRDTLVTTHQVVNLLLERGEALFMLKFKSEKLINNSIIVNHSISSLHYCYKFWIYWENISSFFRSIYSNYWIGRPLKEYQNDDV